MLLFTHVRESFPVKFQPVQPEPPQNLPRAVRKAFWLLGHNADKAINGVGSHDGHDCPIHYAYGISAQYGFMSLYLFEMMIMIKAGWTPWTYGAFLEWYDNRYRMKGRSLILKNYLNDCIAAKALVNSSVTV